MYDDRGVLVTENHAYGGCIVTPNYFPYFGAGAGAGAGTDADDDRFTSHKDNDSGGPSKTYSSLGTEALTESYKYQKDKIEERNRAMIENMPASHRYR